MNTRIPNCFKKNLTSHFGVTVLFGLGAMSCAPGFYSSSASLSNLNATSVTLTSLSKTGVTSDTFVPPDGSGYSSVTLDLGSQFQAGSICSGSTIFGLTGSATCGVTNSTSVQSIYTVLQSNASRTKGNLQLTQLQEVTTYSGGAALPTTGGYVYREVPQNNLDNEGYVGGSVTYATRPGTDCGTSGTLANRIASCALANVASTPWNGAIKGNSGQGVWNLVTRSGANNEVWQDQNTGLLWSSDVTTNANNWCEGAGSADPTDTGYCATNTYSYCVEVLTPASASDGTGRGGTWTTVYSAKKGGMGLQSSPSVAWRLPTNNDFYEADINGLKFVMPDAGSNTVTTSQWSATVLGGANSTAWLFDPRVMSNNYTGDRASSGTTVRCVGHQSLTI